MPERLHNALKRSPIADGVKRAIGQHRQGEGGLERWGETLQPVVNPWGMPEWAALRGEQLASIRFPQPAVAGEFSIIALGNPAGSNNIVVVEAVTVGTGGGVGLTVFLEVVPDTTVAATLTAAAFPACSRDRRFKGITGVTRTFIKTGSDVGNTFGAQVEQQTALPLATSAMQPFIVSLPLILRPGDDLCAIGQTVNSQLTVAFGWRERSAFPGELA